MRRSVPIRKLLRQGPRFDGHLLSPLERLFWLLFYCIRAFNLFNQEVAPPALLAGGATETTCRGVAWPSRSAAANIMPHCKSMMTEGLQIRIPVKQFS